MPHGCAGSVSAARAVVDFSTAISYSFLVHRSAPLVAFLILIACRAGFALDIGAGWGARADVFQGTVGSSLYFDAQYAALSTGLTIYSSDAAFTSWWNFSAVAKLPFTLGPVTLYPEIGAEYELLLTDTDFAGTNLVPALTADEREALNQLWLVAGAGVGVVIQQDLRTHTLWRVFLEVLAGWNPFAAPESAFTLKVNLLYGFVIPRKG